MFMKKLRHS